MASLVFVSLDQAKPVCILLNANVRGFKFEVVNLKPLTCAIVHIAIDLVYVIV